MSASVTRLSSQQLQVNRGSSVVAVLTRVPLIGLSFILIMISLRYLINPIQSAQAAGITFVSPGGITVARVGFAGFPLAFAAFFVSCLFSKGRILSGLRAELMLLAIVIAVRVLGIAAVHSAETAHLLVPEIVMAAFCVLAIRFELNRRKREVSAGSVTK
jgi:hypothetical protein